MTKLRGEGAAERLRGLEPRQSQGDSMIERAERMRQEFFNKGDHEGQRIMEAALRSAGGGVDIEAVLEIVRAHAIPGHSVVMPTINSILEKIDALRSPQTIGFNEDQTIALLRRAIAHVHGNARRMREQFKAENGDELYAEAMQIVVDIQSFLRVSANATGKDA